MRVNAAWRWEAPLEAVRSRARRGAPEGLAPADRQARLGPEHWRLLAASLVMVAVLAAHAQWGVNAGALGALVCAVACVWAARRSAEDRVVWIALTVACAGWALGAGLGSVGGVRSRLTLGPSMGDLGLFTFAIGAAVASLAWPEVRQSARRLGATVIDLVAIVAAVSLWGAAGFPPFGFGPLANAALAQSIDLVLPVATASLAVFQLQARRSTGLALLGSMVAFLMSDVCASGEALGLGYLIHLAPLLQVAGFGALLWAALGALSPVRGAMPAPLWTGEPPFLAAGLLGASALLLAVLASQRTPMVPLFAAVAAAAISAREVLRVTERRRAREQLSSSLDLETRLLELQVDTDQTFSTQIALSRSCALAADVLRASAALAWTRDGDTLRLEAIGPEPSPVPDLLGRQIALREADGLLARVIQTKAAERCAADAAAGRFEQLLGTMLGAGWLLAVPILRHENAVGALLVVRKPWAAQFDGYEEQKAFLIAAQVASGLHRSELRDELEDQLRETTLVHRFAVQAVTAKTVNDVAWYLLESIRSRFGFDRGVVFLADPSSRSTLTPVAHFHPRLTDDGGGTPPATSHLSVPLSYGDVRIGSVEIHRTRGGAFGPDETRVAHTLAQQAAVTIQNLRLREESGKVSTYRELDRLKTDLISAVSHDLRGPLSNIKAYASTLVEPGGPMPADEQFFYLRTIEEEADRLKDLLDHLLDLSKIEAGVLHLDLEPVNIGRLARSVADSLNSPTHRLETFASDDLYVQADRRRLRQVLQNLAENAAKYSPQGGSIRLCAAASEGEVVISVVDEGVGIPRHQWDRIFRPYQRAEGATSQQIAGSGLGLAICKGIVEAHAGRIWVESEPGVGSTFSFTLPRAAVAVEA